ncbi:MAG: hypothetical protein QOE60_611 [Thermoleophilaceae bacterium]|nr:hypothetical protein [Thermoleophilaceae bacterium]
MNQSRAAALVALVLLTAVATGCSYQLKRATRITATAATLSAQIDCGAGEGKRKARKHRRTRIFADVSSHTAAADRPKEKRRQARKQRHAGKRKRAGAHKRAHGRLWLQLRPAGGSAWLRVTQRRHFTCATPRKRIAISKRVRGLSAGVAYQYRLAVDPRKRGGKRLYSPARRFKTAGAHPAPRPLVLPQVKGFRPGLVGTADHPRSALAAKRLGADIVRIEFDVNTPAASLRPSVAALAGQGVQPLLLAGFEGRMPSDAEARNLAGWAAEFGPSGSFWNGRADGRLAVRQIEFGNETSMSYQYGDTWSDQSYKDRAKLYATRLAQAKAAIGATGKQVGLIAQADDGGTGSAAWVDSMFQAVPNLGQLVDGWSVHPYGPRGAWEPKLDRLIAQTAANGAPVTIPIDITEWGISTNNGVALDDNYDWPVNLTFLQAAAGLKSSVAEMRGDPSIGPRLRLFMLYSAYDLNASLGANARERFFGALTADLADKGAYSAEVRALFAP